MLAPAIDVLWTARYDYPHGQHLELHQHNYFQMIYLVSGRGAFHLNGVEQPLRPGTLFLITPQAVHGLIGRSVIKTLDVKFRVKNGSLHEALLRAPSSASPGDPAIPVLLERIRSEGERKRPLYRDVCGTLLQELLLLYLRCQTDSAVAPIETPAGPEPVQSPFLRRALAFIQQNYGRPLAMGELSKALGCSERFMRQQFAQSLSIRPLEYLQRYRIGRAKELMAYSDYELKKIAGSVGFKNVQHFTRIFTAVEGVSPGAWRRKYYEGIRKDVNINPEFLNPSWSRPAAGGRSVAL